MDAQASVVGLLISREDTSAGAVGLLSSIAATAVRLGPPIATLATEHFTFRVVVDFDAKKTDIYITPTILIAQAGHILRYTTGIVETEQGFDQTFLQCKGTATNGAVLQLDSLRLSSSRLTPNMRPIADAGEDKVVAVKQTVILDGRGSYDPDRLPLTYEWIISKQPEGSSIELYGMQKASGVIDPAKFTAKSSGSVGNGISVTVGSPSDSLSLEILGTAVTITPQEDEGVLITTVDLLKTALEDPTDPAYNPSVSELIIVDASDGYTLDDVLEEGSVILGGGIDSNEPVVNFTPFKKGYYEIQLVVNDGQYDSIADTVAVRADDLGLTKGYVPDTSYMWKYLPSVWNEVKDKGIYSTFMSALTQIMSGEYLKAIQYGAAKGLGSVASHFMRRWLKYDLYSSLEETLITYSQYKEYSVEPVDDPSGDPLYTSKLKCLSASLPEVGEIICDSDGKPYTVTNTEGTEHFYISDKIQKVEILDAGNRSGASRDDYDEDDLTSYFTTYYESFSYAVNSQLLLWDKVPDAPQVYEIDEAASTSLVLKLDTEIPNDLDYVQWSIIRPFTDPLTFKKGSVLQILDLDTSTIFTGDAVHIKNKDKTFPVIGKEERDILYLQVDIEDRYLVNGVYHLSQIVIDEHILSVPRLQQVIKDPDVVYQEAEDYIITDSKIVFVVPFTVEDVPEHLWAEVTIFDNDPLIEENFGILVGLPKEAYVSGELDLSYLSAVRGLYFVIFRGPVFAYVRIGSQIFFNLPFFECDGRIESIEPDYNIDRQVGRMLVRDLGIEEFTTGTGSISHDPFSLSDPTKSFRELGVLAGDIVAINKVNYEIETIDAIELLLKDAPPEGDYDYIVRRESTGLIRTYYYSTEYGLEINPD
ncbi:MAG: PKD domain-containing protein, partial [Proteobacteria bacterium]|nr:PKD domain-containing protein [Pseudomonadota bacterium]